MNINGYEIKPRADLKGANLKDADLSFANLKDADLRGADLRGANLEGLNLFGIEIELSQCLDYDKAVLKDLPQKLLEFTETTKYEQDAWCGTRHCLAGEAMLIVGGTIAAHGVLAMKEAIPGFDLSVLYQSDPDKAVAELKKFV